MSSDRKKWPWKEPLHCELGQSPQGVPVPVSLASISLPLSSTAAHAVSGPTWPPPLPPPVYPWAPRHVPCGPATAGACLWRGGLLRLRLLPALHSLWWWGTPSLPLPSRSSAVQPRSPGPTVPAAPSADSGMDLRSCRLLADVCTPASALHPATETAACLLVTAHRAQASQSPAPRHARLHWPGAWHIMSFQLKIADRKIRKRD